MSRSISVEVQVGTPEDRGRSRGKPPDDEGKAASVCFYLSLLLGIVSFVAWTLLRVWAGSLALIVTFVVSIMGTILFLVSGFVISLSHSHATSGAKT